MSEIEEGGTKGWQYNNLQVAFSIKQDVEKKLIESDSLLDKYNQLNIRKTFFKLKEENKIKKITFCFLFMILIIILYYILIIVT